MYSDISICIIASSSPNIKSANTLARRVFPTPVGPKNMKEPMGLLGSFIPARERLTAWAMDVMASSWPTTLLCSSSSIFIRRSDSPCSSLSSGIPVHLDTIWAISSSPISGICSILFSFHTLRCFSSSIFEVLSMSLYFAAFSKSCALTADSFSLRHSSISSSSFLRLAGAVITLRRALEPASSMRSIALSGRYLSDIYLSDIFAAASTASSVILILW